jgi:hypothetical protein
MEFTHDGDEVVCLCDCNYNNNVKYLLFLLVFVFYFFTLANFVHFIGRQYQYSVKDFHVGWDKFTIKKFQSDYWELKVKRDGKPYRKNQNIKVLLL